jgi:hypothetical protein
MLILQNGAKTGQEGVALPDMTDTGSFPVAKQVIWLIRSDGAIPFQDKDVASRWLKHERGTESADPCADHNDFFGHVCITFRRPHF